MVEGYCSRTSVRAGEEISFFVSTNPPSPFRIDFYRMGYYGGAGGRHVLSLGPFEGVAQPDPPVGERRLRECQWEPCLDADDPRRLAQRRLPRQAHGRARRAPELRHLHRPRRPPGRLHLPVLRHDLAGYNRWPSQFSLYDDGKTEWYWGPGVDVSFDRPYGKYCQILDQPLSIGSGELFLWEFPLAFWMEQQGYDVTYISNLDTHADAGGAAAGEGVPLGRARRVLLDRDVRQREGRDRRQG